MAEANSYAKYAGAIYPLPEKVESLVEYGDAINILIGQLDVSGDPPVYPSVNDVRLDVTFGTQTNPTLYTGTVRVPPPLKVEDGYLYDANDSVRGSLVATALVMPSVEDVEFGSPGFGDPDNLSYGVFEAPMPSSVLLGVGYGAYGTEFEGTLTDVPGGSAQPQPPVRQDGSIRSPLTICASYTSALDSAFIWQYTGTAPDTVRFTGRKCCGTYEWDVTGTITDLGDGLLELTFEMPSAMTCDIAEDSYSWQLWGDVGEESALLDSGTVAWSC